jgi:hypothetical protein
MSVISKEKMRIIPDMIVNGGGSGGESSAGVGLMNVLMAQMVKDKLTEKKATPATTTTTS